MTSRFMARILASVLTLSAVALGLTLSIEPAPRAHSGPQLSVKDLDLSLGKSAQAGSCIVETSSRDCLAICCFRYNGAGSETAECTVWGNCY